MPSTARPVAISASAVGSGVEVGGTAIPGDAESEAVPNLVNGIRERDRAMVPEELDHTVALVALVAGDRVCAGHKVNRTAAVLARRAAALDVDDLSRGKHILRNCAWISQAPDRHDRIVDRLRERDRVHACAGTAILGNNISRRRCVTDVAACEARSRLPTRVGVIDVGFDCLTLN